MVRANLKGINTVRKRLRDGSVRTYYYHRSTGERLPGVPGSPEFVTAYAKAERISAQRLEGTVAMLIRDYLLSSEFEGLAKSTRTEYARHLSYVEREFATFPIPALDDPGMMKHVMKWRAKVNAAHGARTADYRLSAFSAMLTWGQTQGHVNVNHLKGVRKLYRANRAQMIWEPAEIEAFLRVAPVELQRAMMLALHTGQRQGDLLKLSWAAYDGQRIRLRQGKRKVEIDIPCTERLKAELDRWPRESLLILTTKTGRPFKSRWFKELWARTAAEASKAEPRLAELNFHDLRGTAVTMLAEAGCTVPEIAAITGHSMKTAHDIVQRYMARTRHLADSAILKFDQSSTGRFANRLQTET